MYLWFEQVLEQTRTRGAIVNAANHIFANLLCKSGVCVCVRVSVGIWVLSSTRSPIFCATAIFVRVRVRMCVCFRVVKVIDCLIDCVYVCV